MPVEKFDFDQFDSGATKHEPKVKEEHNQQAFELGLGPLSMKQVADKLQE